MNESLDALTAPNPLLEIDTSFSDYLSARTRSYKEHMIGGKLDYAFDPDFSLRQKVSSFSGWGKIYKNIISNEIPNKFKRVFQSTSMAGSLKYPEAYDAVKTCSARLHASVPNIYVRNAPNKNEIYSLKGDSFDPAIVITSGLCESCTAEELRFIIGSECGHLQNNHCTFYMAAPYYGINLDIDSSAAPIAETGSMQVRSALTDWICLSDVTADRAGIICCDDPQSYTKIVISLFNKGLYGFYRDNGCGSLDYKRIIKMYETLHITPARHISLDKTWNCLERRIFAGMEFLNCETLYNWRTDIEKVDIHTVNKQALEVRCEIIVGTENGGAY